MSYDPDAGSPEISPDLVFDILSSQRRRMVLFYLRQLDGMAQVNEIAKEIASMENDLPVEELTRQQKKRVYVSLYQTHLPKLAQAGIIDYDREEGQVALTDRAYDIDSYLGPTEREGFPWALYYVALGVAGALLLGWSYAAPAGAPVISPVWVGLLVTVVFGLSAIAQYLSARRRAREIPAKLTKEGS